MAVNKKKLRNLLAKLDPAQEAKLLAQNLSEDIKAVEDKIPTLPQTVNYSTAIRTIYAELGTLKNTILEKLNNLPDKTSFEEIKKKYLEDINTLELKLNTSIFNIKTEMEDENGKSVKDLKKLIQELRIELINKGGGSMNQKISVSGNVMSIKYADFNLLGATAIDNNTTKQVDITLPTGSPSIGGVITGGTAGSILFVNPKNVIAQDNANFNYDTTNKIFTFGGGIVTLNKTLSGTSNTSNFLNVTGTLNAVNTASARGVTFLITSAGSSAQTQNGLNVNLISGYTGGSSTRGGLVNNSAAGTGVQAFIGLNANYGWNSSTTSTTAGNNVGALNNASGSSSLNIASNNTATSANNSPALNVGISAFALNATTNVAVIGALMNTAPTLNVSTASFFDNGSTTGQIIIGRVNGTEKFRFNVAGKLLMGSTTDPSVTGNTVGIYLTGGSQIQNDGFILFDNANLNVSIGNQVGSSYWDTLAHSAASMSNGVILLGYQAGYGYLGNNSVIIGNSAMSAGAGNNQVAIGAQALQNASGASQYNVAIGYQSLLNVAGTNNVAVGANTATSAGDNNVAVGVSAMSVCGQNSQANVAIGTSALRNVTSANNVAIGYLSLVFNTSGASNMGIGAHTMTFNVTGSNNVAIGEEALNQLGVNTGAGGSGNVAIGSNALTNLGTFADWNDNTAIGSSALSSLDLSVGGGQNTAIGSGAGLNYDNAGSIFIGYQAGANETNANQLYIDNSSTATPLIGGDMGARTLRFIDDKLKFDATGKVSEYGNVVTAGWGVPAIYGYGRATGQTTANTSIATYTVGGTDGSFVVSANANITAFIAGTFNVTVAYTDETNTAQTLKLSFSSLTGTIGIALAATGPFEGIPVHIRCKASTAITIATAGTFTSLTYNVEGIITQIA